MGGVPHLAPARAYAAHRAPRRIARAVCVAGLAAALSTAPAIAASASGAVSDVVGGSVPTADPGPVGTESRMVPVGPEPDGTAVALDVSVWPQRDGRRHPAVLLAHGFGGTKESVAGQAAELHDRGYVVVTWTARGFGASGGRIHLDAPDFEVADAKVLVDLAAQRPDVELDAPGDPQVGVMGGSYGGALALMLAGADRRVDGVVAAITWNDLAEAFFPQSAVAATSPTPAGRVPIAAPGPFKQNWASNFFLGAIAPAASASPSPIESTLPPIESTLPPIESTPPPIESTPPPIDSTPSPIESTQSAIPGAVSAGPGQCGRFDPAVCRLFLDAAQTGTPSRQLLDLLHRNSPRPSLDRVAAPTLLVQGMADSLFGIDQADASARALAKAGTPFAVRWTDGGHDGVGTRESDDTAAANAWLDHWVRDRVSRESALPTPQFVYATASTQRGQPADLWSLPRYPGLTAGTPTRTAALPLTGAGVVLRPPGGQPASMIAVPGLAASGVPLSTYLVAALPGQSLALETGAVPDSLTVVGSPRLTLTVTSDQPTVTLFASLWRLTGGQPTLPHALVAPIRVPVTPGTPTAVTISLPAATYRMPAGSTWRVLVTSTEASFTNDRAPARVAITPTGGLVLPVADGVPVGGSGVGVGTEDSIALGGIVLLLLVGAGSAWVRRRRRIHEPARADLAEVPLVVEHLVKTYPDGHRAVDDVSWRAEKGQVVGLLGPNGAGKTTTMRMVMGLIRPDSGTTHVLGQPVSPGSAVLGKVGALIEGPGFLPHLTGRENLQAYWAATGRAPEEAHLSEALDVAALGDALDRPVKSYSHGMRQRLGIAQAMLGRPDLLILDEPTNGLDPPQIAAMRPILRRYADSGRTVVISSHLLAEVELTCTDVVVMHAGRVVTAGRVEDLVDSADTTLLDLAEGADIHRLAAELATRTGITDVRVDTDTRLVVVAGLSRDAVVRTAVDVGLPVVGVSSRRHLEEVFLGVINSAATANGAASRPGDASVSLIERLRQVRSR